MPDATPPAPHPAPLQGRRPSKEELAAYQGATVDDLLAEPLRLLFVGINPGLWTAAVNAHFARPGNRFWPALHLAGVTSRAVDASVGLPDGDAAELAAAGIGVTNIVPVATARADELSRDEVRAGGERLREVVRTRRPAVVAVLGVTTFRQAFGRRDVTVGRDPAGFEGAELWVLPNPSGLNAHETVGSLAAWYRSAAEAAGVPLHRRASLVLPGPVSGQGTGMADDDIEPKLDEGDPLAGAVEHDGRDDAYAEASERIDEALGLDDGPAIPGDRAAGDDAMP